MKRAIIILTAGIILFLTSCITITEKYRFNKDGSGTMEFTLDMSGLLEMVSTLTDSGGNIQLQDMDEVLREAFPKLTEIQGIKNIQMAGEPSKYIFGIKYDFDNIEALNKALAVILDSQDQGSLNYISFNRKTFTRSNLTGKNFSGRSVMDNEDVDKDIMKNLLESMKYRLSLTTERRIRKVDTEAKYEVHKNTVEAEVNFSEILGNKDILKLSVKTR